MTPTEKFIELVPTPQHYMQVMKPRGLQVGLYVRVTDKKNI